MGEPLEIYSLRGRQIKRLQLDGETFVVDVTLSRDGYHNQTVHYGEGRKLRLLEDYGNDVLPTALHEDLFQTRNYTLGIDVQTGLVYIVVVKRLRAGLTIVGRRWTWPDSSPAIVPAPWRADIETMPQKRPFKVLVETGALADALVHRVRRAELRSAVVFSIQFAGENVELYDGSFRTTSDWQIHRNE